MTEQKKKKIPVLIKVITGLTVCYVLLVLFSVVGKDTGPWEGKVLDIETGEPIEGAVVLVVWYIVKPSIGGPVSGAFHRASEVVTDKKGYFFIPTYRPYNFSLITSISEPSMYIYKPGYFYVENANHKAFSKGSKVETKKFTHSLGPELKATYRISSNLIVLPKLKFKDLAERRKYFRVSRPFIPDDEMVEFTKSLNEEMLSIGFKAYKPNK